MRKFFLSLLLALAPVVAHAQNAYGHYQNFCTAGGTRALTQGLNSTNSMLSTFPGCTVTVYLTGTTTPVALFSNDSGASLSNPFTATTLGYFSFYSLLAAGNIDVKMSSAGMTTTTLSNINLVGSSGGGGGVTSINGTTGNFLFTGGGVSCATTTCTFSGGGGSFTVAQYNALLGLPNSAGSTNAALFAAGNKFVVTGLNGPTDVDCAPRTTGGVGQTFLQSRPGQVNNCYTSGPGTGLYSYFSQFNSPVNGQGANGGGQYSMIRQEGYAAGPGNTFFGGWNYDTLVGSYFNSTIPGINQVFSGSHWITAPGDKALRYYYFNYRGGNSTGADEGVTVDTIQMLPLGSFRGTMNGSFPAGSSTVFTTQSGGCPGSAGNNGPCLAGGLVLLKLSTAVPITISSYVKPNGGTGVLGSMTFPETLTPSVGAVTITNAAPVTTNFAQGDTFTSPFTALQGTLPASGIGCWIGTNVQFEPAYYSTSGGNITITSHRYQHSASSQFWAGDCLYMEPTPDDNTFGSKTYFVAVIDSSHTIRYTTYSLGFISNGSFLGSMTFQPGTAGRNVVNLYSGARVIDVADPAAPLGNTPWSTGIAHLEANNVTWVNGEAVEQALYPSDATRGTNLYCHILIQGPSLCHQTEVFGPVTNVYGITLSNSLSDINGTTGFEAPISDIFFINSTIPSVRGSYNTFAELQLLPNGNIISITDTAAAIAGKKYGVIGWPGVEGSMSFQRDIHQWQLFSSSFYVNGKTILDGQTTPTNTTFQAALNLRPTLSLGDPAATIAGDTWVVTNRIRFATATNTNATIPILSEVMQYVGRVTTNGTNPVTLSVTGLTNANGHCSSQQIIDSQAPVVAPMVRAQNGFVQYQENSGSTGQEIDIFCVVK